MGVANYGTGSDKTNSPQLSAWAAAVSAALNGSDTTVDDRIATSAAGIGATLGVAPAGAYASMSARMAAAEARLLALEGSGGGGTTFPYGPGIGMDALANIQIGPSGVQMSYRFRAEQSSTLTNFRVYWLNQDYPGYGGGTGGTIRVTVQADSSGVPSGSALATLDIANPASDFPLKTFGSPATLTQGALYHLVFTNIDGAPSTNFVSVDSIWTRNSTTPRQPTKPDTDYAVLEKIGAGAWTVSNQYTPCVDFTYGNAAHQGIGYMENEDTPLVIAGGSYMVRERIIVSGGNRSITGAAVRMAKTSGTGALTVRLEDSTNTLIDSFTIPAASISVFAKTPGTQTGTWVSGSFSASRALTNGSTYYLRFSTDASTEFWTRGIQRGTSYSFNAATYFADGLAQITTNGSTWNSVSGLGTEGDLQFYLT